MLSVLIFYSPGNIPLRLIRLETRRATGRELKIKGDYRGVRRPLPKVDVLGVHDATVGKVGLSHSQVSFQTQFRERISKIKYFTYVDWPLSVCSLTSQHVRNRPFECVFKSNLPSVDVLIVTPFFENQFLARGSMAV